MFPAEKTRFDDEFYNNLLSSQVDPDVEVVKQKPPKVVKYIPPTRASSRLKQAVKNNKDLEEFKEPKKSNK